MGCWPNEFDPRADSGCQLQYLDSVGWPLISFSRPIRKARIVESANSAECYGRIRKIGVERHYGAHLLLG
jgi:hypothetical protein